MSTNKTTCDIIFDNNPAKVFYGGQLLSGRVVITLHKEKTVRGIYIEITGKAFCRWTQGTGDNRRTYTGDECYLSERTYFVGGREGEVELKAGIYNYTFQCLLPTGLPTSVEGNIGYIRYIALVNLDRPLWPDQEYEEAFTVIKPLNLNDNPLFRYPVSKEIKKTFFFCCICICCSSKPVFMTASIPLGGYAPGQIIPVQIELNNKSDQKIHAVHVEITKIIKYHVDKNSNNSRKRKDQEIKIIEEYGDGCEINEVVTRAVQITVPPVPPTDTSTSNIITVEYRLRIWASVSCCHNDPSIILPLTIGTNPITNFAPITHEPSAPLAPYPASDLNYQASRPPINFPIQKENDTSSNTPPPTYEEAVSGKANIQGKNFTPFYAVYRE